MKNQYTDVKSTGKPFHTNHLGGNRDNADDKLDYTLIPIKSLNRLANHYMNGARKYGIDNWKKLSTPADIKRYQQSMLRHLMQYLEAHESGTPMDEDHLSAVAWNAMCLIYFEETQAQNKTDIDEFVNRTLSRVTKNIRRDAILKAMVDGKHYTVNELNEKAGLSKEITIEELNEMEKAGLIKSALVRQDLYMAWKKEPDGSNCPETC